MPSGYVRFRENYVRDPSEGQAEVPKPGKEIFVRGLKCLVIAVTSDYVYLSPLGVPKHWAIQRRILGSQWAYADPVPVHA